MKITIFPGGSGDTTYNYVEFFTFAVLSLVATIVWTVLARGRPVGLCTRELFATYVRYNLATTMLSYGWHKVIPMQFPYPGPDRLISNFGDASPMGLLWTFMGASRAYQMFAGLGEVLGGLLLFWRRTALLGAIVSAAVLANVVAFNFCYDVPVKLFSSHLLLMALFLIAPHASRLAAVVLFNETAQPVMLRPFPIEHVWVRRALWTAKAAFFVLVAIWPVYQNWQMFKPLAELKPWHGIYRVAAFSRGDPNVAPSDADRWLRVGINSQGIGTIQHTDGSSKRARMEIDTNKGTLTITQRGNPAPCVLNYSMPDANTIELRGDYEGLPITTLLVRQTNYTPLLTTRGFHWINEFPLNR